jgi:2,3-bisphosphoglycerate-dependent phosphoglycerate mutase
VAGTSPTRLVLIRHGESQATVDQVVGGHRGCTGLSELGVRQAAALARRLAATGELGSVNVLSSSILPRAISTAELIAPALGWAPDAVVQDCAFCELHPGECDGMTWEQFGGVYGDPDMRANPYTPLSPGGESLAEFQLRAGRALTQVVRDHPGLTVVLVCHGGVIGASMATFLDLPAFGRLVDLQIDNTSITEWLVPVDGQDRSGLVRFNDVAHLAELTPD